MQNRSAFALAAATTVLAVTSACAQTSSPGRDGRQAGPRPEAIAACEGKAVGATVSFTGPRGRTITGTCQQENGVLAAQRAGRTAPAPTPSN
jgi:hypothetical protein